jgi:2-polyprenyl-6-hydroxyphenyl methylase/3-demethylubiquinone-9 3-methyltransferase
MLLGSVETLDRFAVSGWAIDSDASDSGASVVITVNGMHEAEVPCNLPRSDIRGVIRSHDGRCGFSHRFSNPLSEDINHLVVLRLARTGELLPKGERSVPAAATTAGSLATEPLPASVAAPPTQSGMDRALRTALVALPPLDDGGPPQQAVPCKVCNSPAYPFDVVDFNKVASVQNGYNFGFANIPVIYHRCGHCGYLFTRFFDSWSTEDFGEFIYNSSYVKADPEYSGTRPLRMAEHLAGILARCREARILDYGSGSGEFVEAMRARGFGRIEGYDPFSHPVRPHGKFDLITCFEVIEHTPSPVVVINDMKSLLDKGGGILFTQNLQPADIESIRCSWWYIAPRNGHVSTFTARTLAVIGEQTGLVFHRGEGRHVMRDSNPSAFTNQMLVAVEAPFVSARLAAISAVSPAECWHEPEGPPQHRYRWTAAAEIEWMIKSPIKEAHILQVQIPFVHEVESGFAENCRIAFDGVEQPFHIEGHRLIAEALTDSDGSVIVTLTTPRPRSPAELRGSDDERLLGLAVAED